VRRQRHRPNLEHLRQSKKIRNPFYRSSCSFFRSRIAWPCYEMSSSYLHKSALLLRTRRWVVEHTFSWLSQNQRMSKDNDRLCATAEALVYVAMTRPMVWRLARA
jgi:hypothetical protein